MVKWRLLLKPELNRDLIPLTQDSIPLLVPYYPSVQIGSSKAPIIPQEELGE